MQSELGQYVRRGRKRARLTPQALAVRIGYSVRRANKGARRIGELELEGLEDPVFIVRVLDALGLDEEEARWLGQADEARRREAWERWADEPIRPFLVIRRGPHWFMHFVRAVPPRHRSLVDCERYTSRVLQSLNRTDRYPEPVTAQLVWSHRLHVLFDARGYVKRRNPVSYPSDNRSLTVAVGNKAVVFPP